MRIVVIGGDAAGMSAAHTALRAATAADHEITVTVLEATGHTSYSACGIPYWIAGDVDGPDALVARTAEEHRAAGIDLRLHTRATAIDTDARSVTFVAGDEVAGGTTRLEYDALVLATGARPLLPDWVHLPDGRPVAGVHPVKNLDDGAIWTELLTSGPHPGEQDRPRHAVVVGAGYIGVEMAETLLRRGFTTTVVTRGTVMGGFDEDMGERVADALRRAGVDVRTDTTVEGLDCDGDRVTGVRTSGGETIAADVVVPAIGVVPATELGVGAGLEVGAHGGYLPDPQGRVAPGVWAAGDCCEQRHRLTDERVFLPLGTHANKQGRVVGDDLLALLVGDGEDRGPAFGGVLGTAITRFAFDGVDARVEAEIARTGLSTTDAEAGGYDVASLVTESTTISGYMPHAAPIAIKVLADRGSRALLGVQIVGGAGAGKRVDAAAAALWGRMSVDDLAGMDLSYAPPFATTWDALQIAARRLADRI